LEHRKDLSAEELLKKTPDSVTNRHLFGRRYQLVAERSKFEMESQRPFYSIKGKLRAISLYTWTCKTPDVVLKFFTETLKALSDELQYRLQELLYLENMIVVSAPVARRNLQFVRFVVNQSDSSEAMFRASLTQELNKTLSTTSLRTGSWFLSYTLALLTPSHVCLDPRATLWPVIMDSCPMKASGRL
jgi:hypothetical protein